MPINMSLQSKLIWTNLIKNLRHPFAVCVFLAFVSAVSIVCLQSFALQGLELQAYDEFLALRPETAIDKRITVIGETEADIRRYGHPLSDQVLANALQMLEQAGGRVIGVDKYRDLAVPPGSEALKTLLQQNTNIVWIFFSGNLSGQYIPPPTALADKPEQIGFNDIVTDTDGVLRRGLLFLDVHGASYYSFPLIMALHYLAKENIGAGSDANGYLGLNGVSLPPIDRNFGAYKAVDARGYQVMLDYPGLPDSYRSFTLSDLLDGKVPAEAIADKIVLFGSMAPSLQDYLMLPGGNRRYGVEHHAYFISQLLNNAILKKTPLRSWPDEVKNAWILLWCLAGAFTGLRRSGALWLVGLMSIEFIFLLTGIFVLLNLGWWAPVIAPALGWGSALALSVLYFSSQERAERRQLMQLFASHVSPEVAARLWDAREQFFSEGGVRPDTLTATVLFTDLCGFTTIAEGMEPLALMKWLNQYMEEMSACIIEHGGIINKYIGDAIMAVFGVPIKRETESAIALDAQHAVACAMLFNERLRKLNLEWLAQGLPTVTMRTGIYTGPLVAGSFGGALRMEYTVIGDTVNTAARLESYDKTFAQPGLDEPCRILIGETTYKLVSHIFQASRVGDCELKGKNSKINIYQVLTL